MERGLNKLQSMNKADTIKAKNNIRITPVSSTKEKASFFKPLIQPKLTINQPGDKYEREADAVAEKIMRMPDYIHAEPFFKPSSLVVNSLQQKCESCQSEEELQRKEEKKENIQLKSMKEFAVQRKCASCKEEKPIYRKESKNAADNHSQAVEETLRSLGQSMDGDTKNFMEQRFGYDFNHVQIHINSLAHLSSAAINALAYTHQNHIVFGAGNYQPNTNSGKHLLAHELAHVVQQGSSIKQVIQRKNCDSPHDKMVLERAKKKLEILEPKLIALRDAKLNIETEKLRVLDDRKKIDDPQTDPTVKVKWKMEEQNMNKLNKTPVQTILSEKEIVFKVKFQVFFEDNKMKTQFNLLKNTLQAGINLIWNHTLGKGIFSGRKFSIVPEVNLIDTLSKRSHDFWLIEIRKTDKSKVFHPGCSMADPGPGLPTSVTDPLCDGGVMNIPPAHIKNAGVLGHEMLHLFGLIDRYVMVTETKPPAKKGAKPETKVTLIPLRETAGRKDPLGAEDATILWEDLAYIFSEMGIYSEAISKMTPSLSILESEVRRLRNIIDHGCDPDSLIRIRENFEDKVIKTAEDL
jgi:hypothetical protein